jgi:hypothetical protein
MSRPTPTAGCKSAESSSCSCTTATQSPTALTAWEHQARRWTPARSSLRRPAQRRHGLNAG